VPLCLVSTSWKEEDLLRGLEVSLYFRSAIMCGLTHSTNRTSIRDNEYSSNRALSSRTGVSDTVTKVLLAGGTFGIPLSTSELSAINTPSTVKSQTAVAWMKHHFSLIGEPQPNSLNIELDKQEKCPIYNEYKSWFSFKGHEYLSKQEFFKLWLKACSHVKIKVWKSVCSKCTICSLFTCLRNSFKDNDRRELVLELHAYHKALFSGERAAYYERRQIATVYPSKYFSSISDGMAQIHSEIPWLKNTLQFSPQLKQHLQGVLCHGRELLVFRSFSNVKKTANLAIHCWLLSLEREYLSHTPNSLPSTIFQQIDGGAENVAKAMIAVCELIIAGRLGCSKIVLTRLLVGHTHEDIDAIFALIWKKLMEMSAITPQQYRQLILESIVNKEAVVDLIDLTVIPDYTSFFAADGDKLWGRYAKMDWTQHQFIFEEIEVSDIYPLGCKISYRKFCQDEVCSIIDLPIIIAKHFTLCCR
jgi:hypothetical protein